MDAALQFGRGTPAGNAIYRLYHKKTMDSTLDPELLKRVQKMRKGREEQESLAVRPKVVPKSQTHVPVPRFGRRSVPTSEDLAKYRLDAMGHRKRYNQIVEEMDCEQAAAVPPPRPVINDAEKLRLQQIFQFGEVPPPPTKLTGAQSIFARPSDLEKLEQRFDEVCSVVKEKRQYLDDVKKGHAGGKTSNDRRQEEFIVTNEIAEAVKEMKQLDLHIKSLYEETPRE
jgi:hypothetical protein